MQNYHPQPPVLLSDLSGKKIHPQNYASLSVKGYTTPVTAVVLL